MKSKKEIRDKTLQVMERCLKELKKDLLCRKVTNCLRSQPIKNNGCTLGHYCYYKQLCNEGVHMCDNKKAETCELFDCINTPSTVKEHFGNYIRNPALCGEKFPKLSALLWVLGGDLAGEEKKVDKKPTIKERITSWLKLITA